MKKNLLILSLVLFGSISAMAQSAFKVNGIIEGAPDGEIVLLLASNAEKGGIDTLGCTGISGGKFEFNGSVNGIVSGFIVTQDQKISIPLMLENTDFVVKFLPNERSVTGGAAQKLFNDFFKIGVSIAEEQQRLEGEYSIAAKEKNQPKMQAIQQQFSQFMQTAKNEEMNLIKANADSYVTAYVIAAGMGQTVAQELVARYEILGENARNTAFGKKIGAVVKQIERVSVGSIMPNFTLKTPEGSAVSLASIGGKVKLIDFWASWCEPCRNENINIVKMYRDYNPQGLEIFSVSLDDKREAWIKAIGEDGLTWAQGSDLSGQKSPLLQQLLIQTIPHTILLDKDNRIVAKDLRGDELKKKIEELLRK